MVVYCLGEAEAKRASFRRAGETAGVMSIDNDEILLSLGSGGRTYFGIGEIPFADMTVAEFVAYSKSLIKAQPVRERETRYYARLFGFKLNVRKKLKGLSVVKYRMAQFLAEYDLSVQNVYVNFDGFAYCRKNRRRLDKFLCKIRKYFNIFVAVSDYRFIPQGAAVRRYGEGGQACEINPSAFKAFNGRKRAFRALAKNKNVSLGDFTVKKVVEAVGAGD